MWCRHKYAEVTDGYQYCVKCGVARAAPARVCEHIWKQVESAEATVAWATEPYKKIYVFSCQKCGKLKQEDVS